MLRDDPDALARPCHCDVQGASRTYLVGVDLSELRDYAQGRIVSQRADELAQVLWPLREAAGLTGKTFYGTKFARMIVALADAEAAA